MAMDAVNVVPHARPICVLGMHRSGTSLVARLINLLGVHLGPDPRVLTSGDDNPKGYWEYRPFVDINDEILDRFGGRWDQPPDFPLQWTRDPRLGDLIERARALLAADFAATPLWGWKDPRACLTLPFWQDVIGPMRYVICLRNPAAVVASLARRETNSTERAEHLWLAHLDAALAATSSGLRMFVCYEDLIEDWRPQLRRIAAFIGEPARAHDPRVQHAVDEFLEDELCHHPVSLEHLVSDERISFSTMGLHVALASHARRVSGPGQSGLVRVGDDADTTRPSGDDADRLLDALARRALEAFNQTAAQVVERDTLARERDANARERDANARERDARQAECEALTQQTHRQATAVAVLQTDNGRLTHERDALALREQQSQRAIANLDTALHSLTADRDLHAREHRELRRMLEEIHRSFAWRLVSLARRAIVWLLPQDTRRRRAFHALLRRLPAGLGRHAGADADADLHTA